MTRIAKLAITVLAVIMFAACASQTTTDGDTATTASADNTSSQGQEAEGSDSTEAEGSDSTEVEGQPEYGGTFVQPLIGEPTTLNPAITTGTPELYTACKVFEGLTRLDKDFQPVPGLAESWEVNDDSTEFSFELHEGVTWHDGEPFTSGDVAWSLLEVSDEYGPRVEAPFDNIEEIETPDDHTVVIRLSEPYGPFLNLLTCADSAILPQHIYGDGQDILNHPRNTTDLVGTGPFRFVSWETGSHITLERNEDYWKEGLPYLDEIILQFMADAANRANALEAGEVDMSGQLGLDYNSFLRLRELPGFESHLDANTPADILFFFNTRREPFDDAAVRRALAQAIDREAINERAYFGLATPGKSAITSKLIYHNEDVDYMEMYPFDPETAAEELDAAGVTADADGSRGEMTLAIEAGREGVQPAADIIRANFAEVGIDLTVETLERTTLLDKVFAEHDFDMFMTGYTTLGEVALGVQRVYHCDAVGTAPYQNTSGYCNEEVDRLLEEGRASSDPEQRMEPYQEFQEIIAEDLPTLVILEQAAIGLNREEVHNVFKGGTIYDFWDEVWIEGGGS